MNNEKISYLAKKLVNGDNDSTSEIMSMMNSNILMAEKFVSSLAELSKQKNKVSVDTIALYDNLSTGLIEAYKVDSSDDNKDKILAMTNEIIQHVISIKNQDSRDRMVNKCLIAAGVVVAGILIYKRPETSTKLIKAIAKL